MAPKSWLSAQPHTGLRIAQTVGITAGTFLFGQNVGLSLISIPAVLLAPAPLAARQWARLYNIAKPYALSATAIATISSAYVTYYQEPDSLAFKLNLAATLLFPAVVPFTFLAIVPTNDKLFAKEKAYMSSSLEDKSVEVGVAKEETVHALIDKWGLLNLVRAAITGTGAVVSIWAATGASELAW